MDSETLQLLPEETQQNVKTLFAIVEDIKLCETAYLEGEITVPQYIATLDRIIRSIVIEHYAP